MFREAAQAPECVQAQLDQDASLLAELGERLRCSPPRLLLTCARGSSDHAATYARYLIETRLAVPTASMPLSISSVYGVRRDLSQCLLLAISQSGRSPDLLSAAAAAREAGALVVALVNAPDSPLAGCADFCLPLRAGIEASIAATKSYICSLSACLHLVAHWRQSEALMRAIGALPEQLRTAWQLDWQPLVAALRPAQHAFVLGRGLGLGIAEEAALKLKETCALHAEAFSSAEVQHGPIAILEQATPVLMFSQHDETRSMMEAAASQLSAQGCQVLLAGGGADGVGALPVLISDPVAEPLLMTQSFYRAAAALAVVRGLDPDHPRRLQKATQTV